MPGRALIWFAALTCLNALADTPEEEMPDIELLEFLADWQSDGELIDPELFAEEPLLSEQEVTTEEPDEYYDDDY